MLVDRRIGPNAVGVHLGDEVGLGQGFWWDGLALLHHEGGRDESLVHGEAGELVVAPLLVDVDFEPTVVLDFEALRGELLGCYMREASTADEDVDLGLVASGIFGNAGQEVSSDEFVDLPLLGCELSPARSRRFEYDGSLTG